MSDKSKMEAFAEWLSGFEKEDNTTLDHIRELRIASLAYTGGYKHLLENLPKCETCEYFGEEDIYAPDMVRGNPGLAADQITVCTHPEVGIETDKDFGCIFHSELEK